MSLAACPTCGVYTDTPFSHCSSVAKTAAGVASYFNTYSLLAPGAAVASNGAPLFVPKATYPVWIGDGKTWLLPKGLVVKTGASIQGIPSSGDAAYEVNFDAVSYDMVNSMSISLNTARRRRDVPPRARRAFPDEMKREFWVYCVERRTMSHLFDKTWWGDWNNADGFKPYGFKTQPAALRRMTDVMALDKAAVGTGRTEYRVYPKYVGYVPDAEEWYRDEYPEST